MSPPYRPLILVPWHIGNRLDVTLSALRTVRRLRLLLAEEPALLRERLEEDLGFDCRLKELRAIPETEEPGFVEWVLERLIREEVGMLASGGVPCFLDPGAWLVRGLRARGAPISALAGASILSTVLSLSGIDWTAAAGRGTLAVFGGGGFQAALDRALEPVVVFLGVGESRECLSAMSRVVGGRPVTAFFDLTKIPKSKFPHADEVRTLTCGGWLREARRIKWEKVSDVTLLVHPKGGAP